MPAIRSVEARLFTLPLREVLSEILATSQLTQSTQTLLRADGQTEAISALRLGDLGWFTADGQYLVQNQDAIIGLSTSQSSGILLLVGPYINF